MVGTPHVPTPPSATSRHGPSATASSHCLAALEAAPYRHSPFPGLALAAADTPSAQKGFSPRQLPHSPALPVNGRRRPAHTRRLDRATFYRLSAGVPALGGPPLQPSASALPLSVRSTLQPPSRRDGPVSVDRTQARGGPTGAAPANGFPDVNDGALLSLTSTTVQYLGPGLSPRENYQLEQKASRRPIRERGHISFVWLLGSHPVICEESVDSALGYGRPPSSTQESPVCKILESLTKRRHQLLPRNELTQRPSHEPTFPKEERILDDDFHDAAASKELGPQKQSHMVRRIELAKVKL